MVYGNALCRCCGADREAGAQRRWACKGLCGTCYRRWANQGFPGDGPEPPAESAAGTERDLDGHIAAYQVLLAEGVPTAEICRRIGVTRRTLTRYKTIMAAAVAVAAEPEPEEVAA